MEDERFQVKELYFINGKIHLPRAQDSSSCCRLLHSKLELSYQQRSGAELALLTFCECT